MKLKFVIFFSIAITALFPPADFLVLEAGSNIGFTRDKQDLKALLPDEKRLPGWKNPPDPRFYEPSNLWEYINGQAEMYLQYGFRLVVTSDYTQKENSDSLAVEIYQMESPYHAFALYAAERSPEDNFIKLGVQGYIGENVLNFWKGPFYVKLTSFQDSPTIKENLLKVAGAIADKISGDYSEPEFFVYFPKKNKVNMSERYIPQNFLGHPFLKNGYRVDYKQGENRYQVFLTENSSPEEAEEAFNKYHEFLKNEGEFISLEKKSDYQKIRAKNEKRKVIFQYRSIVGGVLNIKNLTEGEKIIEGILKKLRKKEAERITEDTEVYNPAIT